MALLQRVEYAKTKSDAAAKIDGTWHRDKRTRKITLSIAQENINSKEGEAKDGSLGTLKSIKQPLSFINYAVMIVLY